MFKAQSKRSERLRQADDVIDNSKDPDQLATAGRAIAQEEYLGLAEEGAEIGPGTAFDFGILYSRH